MCLLSTSSVLRRARAECGMLPPVRLPVHALLFENDRYLGGLRQPPIVILMVMYHHIGTGLAFATYCAANLVSIMCVIRSCIALALQGESYAHRPTLHAQLRLTSMRLTQGRPINDLNGAATLTPNQHAPHAGPPNRRPHRCCARDGCQPPAHGCGNGSYALHRILQLLWACGHQGGRKSCFLEIRDLVKCLMAGWRIRRNLHADFVTEKHGA